MLADDTIQLESVDLDGSPFAEAERYVKGYRIDVSDAFQLVSLRRNFFAQFENESQPLLITADGGLDRAATKEKLRVWNVLEDEGPQAYQA